MTEELSLLENVLDRLQHFIASDAAKNVSFDSSSVLAIAVTNCTKRVERIAEKIRTSTGNKLNRAIQRLKWPFEQEEVKKIASNLQRFTQTFQFALQVEGISILSQSIANTEEALQKQHQGCQESLAFLQRMNLSQTAITEIQGKSKQIGTLISILPTLLRQSDDIREMNQSIRSQEEREQGRLKAEILDWLVPASNLQKHYELQNRRVENTCQWFLQSEEWQRWTSPDNAVHDLLCTGNPGVGKSVLASFVVDHLRTKYTGSEAITLCFYCSHFSKQTQRWPFFCRVLLRQICQFLDRVPSSVLDFYRETRHESGIDVAGSPLNRRE